MERLLLDGGLLALKRYSTLIVLLFSIISNLSYAQKNKKQFEGMLNKLLAPGPLMEGHKQLEHTDCLDCHDPGGGVPNKQCLDCHKDINSQVRANKSFHGRMKGKDCISCHRDHKGRDYNAVRFNEKIFDHKRTGYSLTGAHSRIECRECHTQKRSSKPIRKNDTRWWGLSQSCRECHKSDDIHFFKGKFAKVECSKCHTNIKWSPAKSFNHQRETGYALLGNHAKVKCDKCHAPKGKGSEIYNFPGLKTKRCLTCHQDQHGNRLSTKFRGGRCDTCHVQTTWKISPFNHKVTGFPLRGKHARNRCEDCHKQRGTKKRADYKWAGLSSTCGSCHADYHGYAKNRGKKIPNLRNCAQCHTDLGWKVKPKFNHNTMTRFALEGKHLKNRCFECHTTMQGKVKGLKNVKRKYHFPLETKSCESCHKSPHSKSFHRRFKGVKCESCHTAQGWNKIQGSLGSKDRAFHRNTRFPLTGKHLSQPCNSCHLVKGKRVYKFPNADKGFCLNCHQTVHKKQFSSKSLARSCGDCHTTTSFDKRKLFDHNTTNYKITGAHQKISQNCVKCHVPTRNRLPTKPPKVAHKFKFKFAKTGYCESCHKNVHYNQFRNSFIQKNPCISCHTTKNFTQRKIFKHNTTRFKITGRHEQIKGQCFKCHVKTNRMLPTKPPKPAHRFQFPGAERGFCESCHANQHKDMFSRKFYTKPCTECHVTQGFKRLKAFNHNKTSFPLRYKHRRVECRECHTPTKKRYTANSNSRKGLYQFPALKTKNCQVCHKDPHKGSNGPQCTKCHTEEGWDKVDNYHSNFTLEGVHLQVSCEQCHGPKQRMLKGLSQECRVCHQEDDPHGGFLNSCEECHTQTMWNMTSFSHDMTMFPLRGVHRVTDCRSCHNNGNYQALPSSCEGCHFSDASTASLDHSSDRFQACEECHNTFNFSGATLN